MRQYGKFCVIFNPQFKKELDDKAWKSILRAVEEAGYFPFAVKFPTDRLGKIVGVGPDEMTKFIKHIFESLNVLDFLSNSALVVSNKWVNPALDFSSEIASSSGNSDNSNLDENGKEKKITGGGAFGVKSLAAQQARASKSKTSNLLKMIVAINGIINPDTPDLNDATSIK